MVRFPLRQKPAASTILILLTVIPTFISAEIAGVQGIAVEYSEMNHLPFRSRRSEDDNTHPRRTASWCLSNSSRF
jgi:hypothetical protein